MIKTNAEKLMALSLLGEITSPTLKQSYRIQPVTGSPVQLPSVGGICYTANLGDAAVGMMADHVEPGVSIRNPHEASNCALNTFACIGNQAKVVSGDGKGLIGWVTGKHGGVDHVMIHFHQPKDLEQLVIGDKIQIRGIGTGLQLMDYPEITVMNLDPAVLNLLQQEMHTANGQLTVPVTHHIPAQLLGAGLGEDSCQVGDVDIQLFDDASVAQYQLNTLCFGDFVAMEDTDHRYGRIYRQGWVSIGIVTHSCSIQAGHGPGVTTVFTGPKDTLKSTHNAQANLKHFLPA